MSYGGFYTLYTGSRRYALEAAHSGCFLSGRDVYDCRITSSRD